MYSSFFGRGVQMASRRATPKIRSLRRSVENRIGKRMAHSEPKYVKNVQYSLRFNGGAVNGSMSPQHLREFSRLALAEQARLLRKPVLTQKLFSTSAKPPETTGQTRLQMDENLQKSTDAVNFAIVANLLCTIAKLGAFIYTGSGSVLSETLHSMADLANQALLAIGIYRSKKGPTEAHPYGFAGERFVWALISAVGLFFCGAAASVYHGVNIFLHPHELESLHVALTVLGISIVLESMSLAVAIRAISSAARDYQTTMWNYILRGPDPMGVAVLLEDSAAIVGVLIATAATGLCWYTGSVIPDAIGSIMIGTLLGATAVFLIQKNTKALLGQSMPTHKRELLINILMADPVVRNVHNVKAVMLGADTAQFSAEIDFDGAALARNYIEKHNLKDVLASLKDEKALEDLLIRYGEDVVKFIGSEVDRLEEKIKSKVPEATYVDIEAN